MFDLGLCVKGITSLENCTRSVKERGKRYRISHLAGKFCFKAFAFKERPLVVANFLWKLRKTEAGEKLQVFVYFRVVIQ